MIPTLTTDRLTLRAPRPEDVAPFAAFYASDAARFVGGSRPRWETWRYVCEVVGHWHMRGFGRWIAARRSDDAPVGLVGLHHPEDWPEPEIGWMFWETGRGFATEAARAARRWAYREAGLTTLISLIAPDNTLSIALAERLGGVREADFTHVKFGRMGVWRQPGPEEI
ncbi:GNAT family N-acetyltransferase [Jannaschia aquimarina]|uniref:N-acetyltransferase domain-containing protein n=1 Tax=Jannaschia aquimarina TaxID=935700 RepID=A0A0D1CJ39_9RHOB|nr:GNAT family N-acetyltransferase [Jannaschia aquimarina]KIT14727.1 hypothetical protein jaqu_35300 [Jannaschia aquimarina]SNS76862.1 Protein N-acetyltransferase, RimJ/RimL family [Jannaschia aquimarina]